MYDREEKTAIDIDLTLRRRQGVVVCRVSWRNVGSLRGRRLRNFVLCHPFSNLLMTVKQVLIYVSVDLRGP